MSDSDQPRQGLHTPQGPILGSIEDPRRRSSTRMVLQGIGYVVGIGLLVLALFIAFSEKNREGLAALGDARATDIALLVLLTIGGVTFNGLMWWATIRPLKRLNAIEIIAVNALCTFLSVLPFKISVLARAGIHHRRDGVTFRQLVAWFAGITVMGLAALGPFVVASLWRERIDGLWVVVGVGGAVLTALIGVTLGRAAGRYPILRRLSLGSDEIVRHPSAIFSHHFFRLADATTIVARFWVIAEITGYELAPDKAILLGCTYFLVAIASPSALGFIELGTAGLATLVGLDLHTIALFALIITATSIATTLVMAAPAFLWLRPDRLLLPGARTKKADGPLGPPAP